MSDRMDSTTAPRQEPYAEHGTTISAAALAAQLLHAQRDNSRLIGRIVELEHERDRLAGVIRHVLTMGLPGHATAYLRAALGDELAPAPPRAQDPAPHCWNCGLPLTSAHIRDEVVITQADRYVSVHRACADHLVRNGWEIVALAKGIPL